MHEQDVVAKSPLYTMEITVRQFRQWCIQEVEVGDIMLEALEREENNRKDPRFVTVFKNENLSTILQQQECIVSSEEAIREEEKQSTKYANFFLS